MQPKLIAAHGSASYGGSGSPCYVFCEASDFPLGESGSGTAIAIPLAIIGAAVVIVLGLHNKKS